MQCRTDKIFIPRSGVFAEQLIQRAGQIFIHASMADVRNSLVKFD